MNAMNVDPPPLSPLEWAVLLFFMGTAFIALPLTFVGVVVWAWWERLKETRRDRLAELGVCPHCGYDNRKSGRLCPECGKRNPVYWKTEVAQLRQSARSEDPGAAED